MTTEATTAGVRAERDSAQAPPGRVLAVLLSAMFMGQFDFFVVNVAAPSLQHDIGAGEGALELIVGGYAFAYAGGLVTGGRLGDLFGYRRMFVSGMAAFAVTSLLCGVCATPDQLVVARLAQGLAAALMLPQVLAIITATYAPSIRPRALAWYSAAAGLGAIAGQVFGGFLVSSDIAGLGWRLIFFVNVPIGAVAAALALRMLPTPDLGRRPGLDPAGAVGIALALALVLAPLTLGRTRGWPLWTWICMAAAVPVAVATLRWQRSLGARGGDPVLNLAVLRTPSFRAGLVANAAFMLFFPSFMFTLTLLLQGGLGLDAFQAGLAFAPAGLAYSVSALLARPVLGRYGLRAVVVGCLITAIGLGLLLLQVATAGPDASVSWVVLTAALMSLGNGVVMPSLIGAALREVEPHQAGAASGMLTTAQQFASSAGVALIGTAFFAAAHTSHGAGGYTTGMTWAGLIDLALVLVVAALVGTASRAAKRG